MAKHLMVAHVVFVGGHSLWQYVNYIMATCEPPCLFSFTDKVIKSCACLGTDRELDLIALPHDAMLTALRAMKHIVRHKDGAL